MRPPLHRMSENSLAFAQKSKELGIQSFMALHGGIGLGGIVIAKHGFSSLGAQVSQQSVDGMPFTDSRRKRKYETDETLDVSKSVPRSNRYLNFIRMLFGNLLDIVLVGVGIAVVCVAVGLANREMVAEVIQWQAKLSHLTWVSGVCAVFSGAYLAYWLCFISLVGRTPGRFLTNRNIEALNSELDVEPNPLIHKA